MTHALEVTRDGRLGGSPFEPTWFSEPEPRSFVPKQRYRTVWISDIHLGTAGCNADLLIDFLHSIECETLYLVGDIIDGWRLRDDARLCRADLWWC